MEHAVRGVYRTRCMSSPSSGNYLIEFKNGNARKEKAKIGLKARESEMIINAVTDRQITDSRQTDIFVLVYNEDNVSLTTNEKRAKALAKKGRSSYVLFELGKMIGFFFSMCSL